MREEQIKIKKELDSVRDEHRHWSVLTDPEPPRSRFRSAEAPAGSPLFRLIDFADHLDDRSRAGLEAALESSGLIGGVFAADGTVVDPANGEIVLRPAPPVSSASLRDALVIVPGAEPVATLLAGIGWGSESAATSWIAADGRWAPRRRARRVGQAGGRVRRCRQSGGPAPATARRAGSPHRRSDHAAH